MHTLLLALLRCYKFAFSPMLGHRCRFMPSCADYAHHAIKQYGAARGSLLALKRTLSMDVKRSVLWIIFTISLVMLFDNWQREHGRSSLFFPSATSPQTSG